MKPEICKWMAGIVVLCLTFCVNAESSSPEPLLWKTYFESWGILPTEYSKDKNVFLKKEEGRAFLQADGRRFMLIVSPVNGEHIGDSRLAFDFRPNQDSFEVLLVLKELSGGSRRYRGDLLKNIELRIQENTLTVTSAYTEPKAAPPNVSAAVPEVEKATPFPKIENGSYNYPSGFAWGQKWHRVTVVTDQYELIVSIDGKEVAKHKINPAAGRLSLGNVKGLNDFANFELREIRPAFNPYLEENLVDWRKK